MKAPYLALVVSYFALAAFAQDSAYIINGTGNVGDGEPTPVAPVPGNGDSSDSNGQVPPNQFYPPPFASQGYSSSRLQDGMESNSVGPVGPYPNPYQTVNPDPNQNSDPNQTVDPNQDPNRTGIVSQEIPPQGTEETTGIVQPTGGSSPPPPPAPGHGGNSEALASEALASSSSALQDGWTPGVPSTTQAPPPGGDGASTASGRTGNNGYITTTLAIAIPIPLNASDYDPNAPARIITQFGGAANVQTSALAVVVGIVGAVAGAALL